MQWFITIKLISYLFFYESKSKFRNATFWSQCVYCHFFNFCTIKYIKKYSKTFLFLPNQLTSFLLCNIIFTLSILKQNSENREIKNLEHHRYRKIILLINLENLN